jgi:hypothetical protein
MCSFVSKRVYACTSESGYKEDTMDASDVYMGGKRGADGMLVDGHGNDGDCDTYSSSAAMEVQPTETGQESRAKAKEDWNHALQLVSEIAVLAESELEGRSVDALLQVADAAGIRVHRPKDAKGTALVAMFYMAYRAAEAIILILKRQYPQPGNMTVTADDLNIVWNGLYLYGCSANGDGLYKSGWEHYERVKHTLSADNQEFIQSTLRQRHVFDGVIAKLKQLAMERDMQP